MINEKFKAMVHYVCDKCEPSKLGAIKLNKILWLSDVLSYMNRGQAISPETYLKRQRGPVPEHILRTLEALEGEGKLRVREVDFHGFKKKEFIALEEADTSVFTDEELELIDDMAEYVCNDHTADSISNLSHNAAWEAAAIGEEIPHYAAFMWHFGEVNEFDMNWAQEQISGLEAA